MKNIQKQMDSIARNKSKFGTVIDTRTNRCVGKSFNIEKIAEYFGFTVIKKFHTSNTRSNVGIIHRVTPDHIRGKNNIFVIDEGYSILEIFDFMQNGTVAFALWSSDYDKNFEKLHVDKK